MNTKAVNGEVGQAAHNNNPLSRPNTTGWYNFVVCTNKGLFATIIRRFFGNVYIVRMALAHAGIGDLDEFCFLVLAPQ